MPTPAEVAKAEAARIAAARRRAEAAAKAEAARAAAAKRRITPGGREIRHRPAAPVVPRIVEEEPTTTLSVRVAPPDLRSLNIRVAPPTTPIALAPGGREIRHRPAVAPTAFDPRQLQRGRGTNRVAPTPLRQAIENLPPGVPSFGLGGQVSPPQAPDLIEALQGAVAQAAFGGTGITQNIREFMEPEPFEAPFFDPLGALRPIGEFVLPGTGGRGLELEEQIELEGPPEERPWWWNAPGGLGTFDEARRMLKAGILIPDVTPQVQRMFGFSDTGMLNEGYVFDEATNKWILPETGSLAEAQAGLGAGGGGFGGFGGGGGGINIQFPKSARAARGSGLTNWRV